MMKNHILPILFILMTMAGPAQQSPYRRVKLPYSFPLIQRLSRMGMPIEMIHNDSLLLEIGDHDYQMLVDSGISHRVEISDLENWYRNRNLFKDPVSITDQYRDDPHFPYTFSLGSMGGLCTYDEMLMHLHQMSENYPDLISAIDSISGGSTIEGRPVYWWKISDNPNLNEEEPEILYTGLIHAREPVSMQQLLYFMYYLLENYDSDAAVARLVNENELYFIPCINPDGYLYNQSTHPDGGGMWRKNRRDNGNGTFGVDLNRNFGYQWGFDNFGSSPDPLAQTYRGTAPFSEPESHLIRTFVESHEFLLAVNYHSYGDLLMFPWGFRSYPVTPDFYASHAMAKRMTTENGYCYGIPGVMLYLTNGDINDWLYGETVSKNRCLPFVVEIGSSADGFWPAMERIIPLCEENLKVNLELARMADFSVEITDLQSVNLFKYRGYLSYGYTRTGLEERSFSIEIIPLDSIFDFISGAKTYSTAPLMKMQRDSLEYLFKPGRFPGDSIRYLLRASSGTFQWTDTMIKYFGPSRMLLVDDCSSMQNWQSEGWDVSHLYFHSPDSAITHAPVGSYPADDSSVIVLRQGIDLTGETAAWMSFYMRWDLLGGRDYVSPVVSADGGENWWPINGRLSDSLFAPGHRDWPVYLNAQPDWIREWFDLTPFTGDSIWLGFRFFSDHRIERTGFYFDDVVIEALENTPASQTLHLLPGWNDLSSRLLLPDPRLDSLWLTHADALQILSNLNGFYSPGNGNSNLTIWQRSSGYFARLTDTIALQLTGFPDGAGYLDVESGWSLIPVLSSRPMAAINLRTDPHQSIILIREALGTRVFWPEQNIFSLDSLQPGHAYLIKTTANARIFFPVSNF